jgi:hypothetical protein
MFDPRPVPLATHAASTSAVIVVALVSSTALAQTYSASDSVFAPSSWTQTVEGSSSTRNGSVSQVLDGYALGSNARLTTLSPGGTNAWNVSIYEGFSYTPTSLESEPNVTISFDSRWVAVDGSRVGPAMRQGSTVWAGFHPINTASWTRYTFTGWSSFLPGTILPLPDLSPGAAPIYFGFYQRNGGNGTGFQSEFANFSVTVTATPVPVPSVLVSLVALTSVAGPRSRGHGRRRA